MPKFVIYIGRNEILVTTQECEQAFLSEYNDRDFGNDYERLPHNDVVGFSLRTDVNTVIQ